MLKKHFPEIFLKKKAIPVTPNLVGKIIEERRRFDDAIRKRTVDYASVVSGKQVKMPGSTQKGAKRTRLKVMLHSNEKINPGYLSTIANQFVMQDIDALRVNFQPASSEDIVIPVIEVTDFPEKYVLPDIHRRILRNKDFNIGMLDGISDANVKTFIRKMYEVVENENVVMGTRKSKTDMLVNKILHILNMDSWPLWMESHPICRLFITNNAYVSAEPEIVIRKRDDISMIIAGDKHLRSVGPITNFGETQLAAEMLACGYENMQNSGKITDQTIFFMRVISTYATFYKAIIPAEYWMELGKGLPQSTSVMIERWPGANGLETGLDIGEPEGRQSVLTALIKIRQFLSQ